MKSLNFNVAVGLLVLSLNAYASDLFTITQMNSMESFEYSGMDGEYIPTPHVQKMPNDNKACEPYPRVTLSMARNEQEDFRISISSNTAPPIVTNIEFVKTNRAKELKLDISIVGDLEGKDIDGSTPRHFPDPLFNVKSIDSTFLSRQGLRFLFSVRSTGADTAGVHEAEVTITFQNGFCATIPTIIDLKKFTLPAEPSIQTDHFNIDEASLAYHFGIDVGTNAFTEYYNEIQTLLINHRITNQHKNSALRNTGALPKQSVDSDNRNYLIFTGASKLISTGPQLYDVAGFSIDLNIRPNECSKTPATLIRHQWGNRKNGYKIQLVNNKLVVTGYVRNKRHSNTSFKEYTEPKFLQLETVIHQTQTLQNWKFSFDSSQWSISLDGKTIAVLENVDGEIVPPIGGTLEIGDNLCADIYELEWHSNNKEENNRTLWKDIFERANLRNNASHNNTSNISTNELTENIAFLPVDERTNGRGLEINKAYATKMRSTQPAVKLIHTFGSMRGAHKTKAERLDALSKFVDLIDVWSIRPNLFLEQYTFFSERVKSGDQLSIYVHDVNLVERMDKRIIGRKFFWWLFAHNINRTTFWNVNLWFQAEKPYRPARVLKRTRHGYSVTQRNPSGLGAGMIFYPYESSILPSLRSYSWRDGLEDYEILLAYQQNGAKVDNLDGWDKAIQLSIQPDKKPSVKIKSSTTLDFSSLRNLALDILDKD